MKKKVIRLTEGDLHRIINKSVKKALKEDLEYDDNGYPSNLPSDVEDWAKDLQNMCARLYQLKGKYRMMGEWNELVDNLDSIYQTLDGLCADLNTYGMSSHWSL